MSAKTKAKAKPEAEVLAPAADSTPDAPSMDVESLLGKTLSERMNRPAMTPPNEAAIEAEEGITAWHNGKKITGMWTNSSTRNAYAAVAGLGWKRISNANDSSHLSMVMMAAHAEQTGATVNLEIGTDQEIHQIYVW